MNKTIALVVMGTLCYFSLGCASMDKGRFSVVDLDLRSKDQIEAQIPEATCIYNGSTNKTNDASLKSATPIPWEFVVKLVEVFKGRIKVCSMEWKTNQ